MAMRELNYTLGQDKLSIGETGTVTAITGGAADLGGTIGVRLLIDDVATPSKADLYRALKIFEARILEDTWPLS